MFSPDPSYLVDFDGTVNHPIKGKCAEKAGTTAKETETETDYAHVGQVNEFGKEANQFQSSH